VVVVVGVEVEVEGNSERSGAGVKRAWMMMMLGGVGPISGGGAGELCS
jgi:hypothetical protein